jgi:protocatechuate 3,4-dioxygenase beta subunit
MTDRHEDAHDRGLQFDLARNSMLEQRRRALRQLLAGGAGAFVAACGGGGSTSATTAAASSGSGTGTTTTPTTGSCIANASETNGPYPSDGSNTIGGVVSNVLTQSGVVRQDIRGSFGSSTGVAAGVPLTLTLQLLNSNNSCAALAGYAVYLWHCTRDGLYSLYSSGVTGENFLRGVQVADSSGMVTFQTIFPGCYAGRYPHIHFEVYPSLALATNYTNRALTSQIALPRDVCTTVYASTGYASSATNLGGVTIASDGVFGDNTSAQMAQMTAATTGSVAAGYAASVVVGVPV